MNPLGPWSLSLQHRLFVEGASPGDECQPVSQGSRRLAPKVTNETTSLSHCHCSYVCLPNIPFLFSWVCGDLGKAQR